MRSKGVYEDEFEPTARWAHGRGMGITFIEVMPLGDAADLRTPLRASEGNERLHAANREAIARKPIGP